MTVGVVRPEPAPVHIPHSAVEIVEYLAACGSRESGWAAAPTTCRI